MFLVSRRSVRSVGIRARTATAATSGNSIARVRHDSTEPPVDGEGHYVDTRQFEKA